MDTIGIASRAAAPACTALTGLADEAAPPPHDLLNAVLRTQRSAEWILPANPADGPFEATLFRLDDRRPDVARRKAKLDAIRAWPGSAQP